MIPFEAFFVKSKNIAFWEKGEACKGMEEKNIILVNRELPLQEFLFVEVNRLIIGKISAKDIL
ncbi:hypothetical protein [Anaerotignum sp.]|uniref:hypothetical protein n=1 Tax=Anaerotignum sp. TaxID=2039241 RepID=UPI0028A0F6E2|nr:hypothetical protein [Anaerotignum sp.]